MPASSDPVSWHFYLESAKLQMTVAKSPKFYCQIFMCNEEDVDVMKESKLSTEESRALREMGIYHPHASTRRRA
jgi:hypothetical protein